MVKRAREDEGRDDKNYEYRLRPFVCVIANATPLPASLIIGVLGLQMVKRAREDDNLLKFGMSFGDCFVPPRPSASRSSQLNIRLNSS